MIIGLLGQKGAGKDTAGTVLARELNGTCIAFADPMKRFCKNALGLTERQLWGDAKEKRVSKAQLKRLNRYLTYTVPGDYSASNPPKSWSPKDEVAKNRGVRTPLADHLLLACGRTLIAGDMTGPSIEGQIRVWLRDLLLSKSVITPRLILQTFGTEFGRKHLREDFWIQVGLTTTRQTLDGYAYDHVQGLAKRHGGSDAAIITDVRFRNEVLAVKRAGGKIVRIIRRAAGAHASAHTSESEQLSIPDFWCDAVVDNSGTRAGFEDDIGSLARVFKQNIYRY